MNPADLRYVPKEPGSAERTAAAWVLRRQRGLSPREERAFAAWMKDRTNAALFAEMAETSELLDGLRTDIPDGTVAFEAPVFTTRRSVPWLRIGVAAACLGIASLAGWKYFAAPPPFTESVATDVGGLRTVNLPDGSVVHLNTDSQVAVTYTAAERRLRLIHGEAYFSVAKNPNRPFWVEVGPVSVRAVGTAFNIRMQSDQVSVLVTEGRVRVADGDGRQEVRPTADQDKSLLTVGHLGQVPISPTGSLSADGMVVSSVEPHALKSVMAWQQGRLEFFERPLSEVVEEFNRYNRHKIVIADPALASRRFGGAFASHQIAPLLELLEQSFGVVSEERADQTVIRLAK
jgi:transmembrane sensor